jgi:glycosyltransferase involved in cell wall biosynthesis
VREQRRGPSLGPGCVVPGPRTVLWTPPTSTAIRAQLPVKPVFEATAYPSRDGAAERDLLTDFDALNSLVERDLHRFVEPRFHADDLLLVPTARDIHLTGIYRWYSTLPSPRPKICLRLLFEPWFRAKREERELAVEHSRRQLRGWAALARDQLVVVSERRELAQYYEGLCGVRVRVLPMPIRYPDARRDPPPTGGSSHIVFLGEARREKGFHLYPDALAAVVRRQP